MSTATVVKSSSTGSSVHTEGKYGRELILSIGSPKRKVQQGSIIGPIRSERNDFRRAGGEVGTVAVRGGSECQVVGRPSQPARRCFRLPGAAPGPSVVAMPTPVLADHPGYGTYGSMNCR